MKKNIHVWLILAFLVSLTACSAEVGSEKWCNKLKDRPAGEWTVNEAADYAKHCLIN